MSENEVLYDFLGCELTAREIEIYKTWLNMDASRIHNKVMAKQEEVALRNLRRDPEAGSDYWLHTAKREQFIGQSVAYDRVQGIREALEAIDIETEVTGDSSPH